MAMMLQGLLRLILPGDGGFYQLFQESAGRLPVMAGLLKDLVNEKDTVRTNEIFNRIKQLEEENDNTNHRIRETLARVFITPIDRELIHYLGNALDDVADFIYACSRSLGWMPDDMGDAYNHYMAGIIQKSTAELVLLIEVLTTRKRENIFRHIEQLHALRREMDIAYDTGMQKLYLRDLDFKSFIRNGKFTWFCEKPERSVRRWPMWLKTLC